MLPEIAQARAEYLIAMAYADQDRYAASGKAVPPTALMSAREEAASEARELDRLQWQTIILPMIMQDAARATARRV